MCKLCAWVIFLIVLTGLLCDNSNSLTREHERGKVRHLHVQTVWLYISCRLAFHSKNSNSHSKQIHKLMKYSFLEYFYFHLLKLLILWHQFCRNPQFYGIFVIFDRLVEKTWTSQPYLEDKCQIRWSLPVCHIKVHIPSNVFLANHFHFYVFPTPGFSFFNAVGGSPCFSPNCQVFWSWSPGFWPFGV